MPTMVMSALYDRISCNAIMWMTYSAEFIDAQQAMIYGIVSREVDADKLEDEVTSPCETLPEPPAPRDTGSQGIFARCTKYGPTRRTRLRAQSAFHGQHSGGDEGIKCQKNRLARSHPVGGLGGGACIAAGMRIVNLRIDYPPATMAFRHSCSRPDGYQAQEMRHDAEERHPGDAEDGVSQVVMISMPSDESVDEERAAEGEPDKRHRP